MAIPSINGVTSNPAPTAESLGSQLMNQGDFLKLLIAQMTSQDPIKPMDNQDMLAQMVQFSTLQGNTSLQSTLSQMQTSQGLLQANSLIGRQVSLQVDSNTVTQGVVSGVDASSGNPRIVVNGVAYDLSQVLSIALPPANS